MRAGKRHGSGAARFGASLSRDPAPRPRPTGGHAGGVDDLEAAPDHADHWCLLGRQRARVGGAVACRARPDTTTTPASASSHPSCSANLAAVVRAPARAMIATVGGPASRGNAVVQEPRRLVVVVEQLRVLGITLTNRSDLVRHADTSARGMGARSSRAAHTWCSSMSAGAPSRSASVRATRRMRSSPRALNALVWSLCSRMRWADGVSGATSSSWAAVRSALRQPRAGAPERGHS